MDHTFGEEVERKKGEQEELRNIKCVAEVWKYTNKRRGEKNGLKIIYKRRSGWSISRNY